jgi:hypothetical protein
VQAQVPDSTQASLAATLREAQLRNRIIQLQTSNGDVQGRVIVLSDSRFRVGRNVVGAEDVRLLKVRFSNPDPLWNGALIGGVGVSVILAPLLTEFAESMGERKLTTRETISFWIGSALFGVLNGVMWDAAVERAPSWRTVWNATER